MADFRDTREEVAKREIGHTDISPGTARFLTAFFLGFVFCVPAAQHLRGLAERGRDRQGGSLAFYEEFRGVFGEMADAWRKAHGVWGRVVRSNRVLLGRMNAFERSLDDRCVLTLWFQTPVQEWMCRLGVGNERSYVGRAGWLFYEPDVRHVTGPGFLEAAQMTRRRRGAQEWRAVVYPDPVPAIEHFRDQLRRRGVELVAMPVPAKPSFHPERFTARRRVEDGPVYNASYLAFLSRLTGAGIPWFDCSPILAQTRAAGRDAYLKTDTHWRPEVVEKVAAGLADFLQAKIGVARGEALLVREERSVRNRGDVAVMLRLPGESRLFPEEGVTLREVVEPSGTNAVAGRREVLLLGDSFANIYSLPEMGWGERAGLADHLSMELRQTVDRIVRNDAGSYATREMLARDLARGADPLAGKKVVVWQFAVRELSDGDWKMVAIKSPGTVRQPTNVTETAGQMVTGTVAEVSTRPDRNAVYADFIMKLYVTDLTEEHGKKIGAGDGVLHVFGMRARQILPIASARKGDSVRFRIRPWSQVKDRYTTLRSGELGDTMLEIEKPLYWGEPE